MNLLLGLLVCLICWTSLSEAFSTLKLQEKRWRGHQHAVSTGNGFAGETSSSSNKNSNNNGPRQQPQQPPTLYEVLGAATTDTRAELKQKYVILAKQFHPDAVRHDNAETANQNNYRDFSEIAAAWRILSDPAQRRRYDRSLKAERLAEDIASFVSKQAVPVADYGVKALEKVAFPFLRRTTATTLASMQAAFGENKDLSKTFSSAFQAAQHAGRAVDQMELLEKAEQLEKAAVEEYKQVVTYQNELSHKASERLKMSLHTTNSGITSAEAMIVLESFNQTLNQASPSVWERANPLRHNVEQEIGTLKKLEADFVETQQLDAASQEEYRYAVQGRMVAQKQLLQAEAEEEKARQVYEAAMAETSKKRRELEAIQSEMRHREDLAQRSSSVLENLSEQVGRQSETVRHALRKRERAVYKNHQNGSVILQPIQSQTNNSFAAFAERAGYEMSDSVGEEDADMLAPEYTVPVSQEPYKFVPDCATEEENKERLKSLMFKRQEERALAEKVHQMEVNAARLLSRANKLKTKARDLQKQAGKR